MRRVMLIFNMDNIISFIGHKMLEQLGLFMKMENEEAEKVIADRIFDGNVDTKEGEIN